MKQTILQGIRKKIIPSILTFLFLYFSAIGNLYGQTNTQNQLLNPELFEDIFPKKLAVNWVKSGFSTRTSASENWGGASYMGDGGAIMQIGLRHFTPSKWSEKKAEAQKENEAIEIGDYSGYLGKTMGQTELIVYFDNNFSARIVGSGLTVKNFETVLEQIPLEEINDLADHKANTLNVKTTNANNSESLKSLLPDTLAGMLHGRINSVPNKPIIAVTYGNDDLPYSVNIQIAAGEPMKKAKTSLEEELNETTTDLKEINHSHYKLWFREEESAVSFSVFLNKLVLFISADAPANSSFDKKAARSHLIEVFDELESGI